METKTLTILFADVQGFTSKTSRQTREETTLYIEEINLFIKKYIKGNRGRLIKTMGDGFLLSFESPTDAVRYGVQLQENLEKRNASVLDVNYLTKFRIGISTGEVCINEEGDVFGGAVNIAARIEMFACPNNVYISEATYLAMNHNELDIRFKDLGLKKFKNLQQKVRVYKALIKTKDKLSLPGTTQIEKKTFKFLTLFSVFFLLIAVALWNIWYKKISSIRDQRPLELTSQYQEKHREEVGLKNIKEVGTKTLMEENVTPDPEPEKKSSNVIQQKQIVTNSLGMRFVLIEPGSFVMGSPSNEVGRDNDEKPHRISLTKSYYMQTTEVTVGQWRTFVIETGYKTEAEVDGGTWFFNGSEWKKNPDVYWNKPGFSQSDESPVTCLSWNDIQFFLNWINQKDGYHYRLPSEAEWEYACRSGTSSARFWGDTADRACYYANVYDISSKISINLGRINHDCDDGYSATAPVGSFKPNSYQLYDMLGNVWEWCSGRYYAYPAGEYAQKKDNDSTTENRVFRGGGWHDPPGQVRSANRRRNMPSIRLNDLGFRLVITP